MSKTTASIALATLIAFAAAPALAQNCATYGNQTICDNGQTLTQYGNQTIITPPTNRPNQPTRTCVQYGNQTICN